MKQKVVIFGTGEFAEVAAVYLTEDGPYEVVAFTIDRAYRDASELLGRPVVPFEDLGAGHGPDRCAMLVAVGFSGLNSVRTELYERCKRAGYRFVSYVNSRAARWGHVEVGENSFVFENNVLQPFCRIGNNCVLWSGNHVGHHSRIEDNCFITSHVVISGGSVIGRNCFVGVNATVGDHVRVGENCVLGAGSVVLHDAEPGGVYLGQESERSRVPSHRLPGFRPKKAV